MRVKFNRQQKQDTSRYLRAAFLLVCIIDGGRRRDREIESLNYYKIMS